MNVDGTGVRQVTDVDRACTLVGFGVDAAGAEVLTFTASLEGDVYRSPRPYQVATAGGDVVRVHGAFGSEAIIRPGGGTVAAPCGRRSIRKSRAHPALR